jgi:hypothetical protein
MDMESPMQIDFAKNRFFYCAETTHIAQLTTALAAEEPKP